MKRKRVRSVFLAMGFVALTFLLAWNLWVGTVVAICNPDWGCGRLLIYWATLGLVHP